MIFALTKSSFFKSSKGYLEINTTWNTQTHTLQQDWELKSCLWIGRDNFKLYRWFQFYLDGFNTVWMVSKMPGRFEMFRIVLSSEMITCFSDKLPLGIFVWEKLCVKSHCLESFCFCASTVRVYIAWSLIIPYEMSQCILRILFYQILKVTLRNTLRTWLWEIIELWSTCLAEPLGNGKVWRRWCCTAVSYFWPSPPSPLKLTFHMGWQANLQCIYLLSYHHRVSNFQQGCEQNTKIEGKLSTWDALPVSIYLQCNEHINLLSKAISNLQFMLLSTSQRRAISRELACFKTAFKQQAVLKANKLGVTVLPSFRGLPGNIWA